MNLIAGVDFSSRAAFPLVLNALGLTGNGAEVGVQRGVNASHIRRLWSGEELYCVDPWEPYTGVIDTAEMHESYLREALAALQSAGKDNWQILRKRSLEAAALLRERGVVFDWVYLDGDHFYEAVLADIEAWWPLVRSGGVLAGHDYVPDGWHRNGDAITAYASAEEAGVGPGHCGPFGVVRAVTEVFGPGGVREHKVHLTSPETDDGWRSWLVVKS